MAEAAQNLYPIYTSIKYVDFFQILQKLTFLFACIGNGLFDPQLLSVFVLEFISNGINK